jgi:guanylate kinase
VIAGPSGVGKGTVVATVLGLVPDLFLSVSATTRPARPVEREGIDYVFLSDEAFDRMVEGGELLEWAPIFGHRYGTPAEPVQRALASGRDVLLEVDVQGARQVKDAEPEAVLILLSPPSANELERRLRDRGTEGQDKLDERLAKAEWELGQRDWFDHEVVNDDVETASSQVAAIIQGSRPPAGTPDPGGSPDP